MIEPVELRKFPHRRYNPLTSEWILVSPQRTERPWQGQVERSGEEALPRYDPTCYLCPGNKRAGDQANPNYPKTFVFDNDFSALFPESPPFALREGGLLVAEAETGVCRVVCFSPRHDLTLARMSVEEIRSVVDVLTDEYARLSKRPDIRYVQIFENKGELMGCSNPHPHCQIWAQRSIPVEPQKESRSFSEYYGQKGRTLLQDYLTLELQQQVRLVLENDHFVIVVPFWAVWPFETMVISRRAVGSMLELTDDERNGLADILRRLTCRYDNIFHVSFPYSAGIHQAPTDKMAHPEWHFHIHFYPPLLRSATIRKFMVGYEMLANPQRDITAEVAAERLRALSDVHYSNTSH